MEMQSNPQKKWYKKWWVIVIGVLIGIIVLSLNAGRGLPMLKDVPTEVTQSVLRLNGFGVENNATVKIYLNGNLVSEIKADSSGNFTTRITLVEGKNTLYATASYKDTEKKSSEKTITYNINQEKIDEQNKAEADARAVAQEAQQKADNEAKIALEAQTKADEPVAQEFQHLIGFAGYKSSKSSEFYIKSAEVKFVYSCKGGLVVCNMWLRSTEGKLPQQVFHSSGSTGDYEGEVILTVEPGAYYLEGDTRDRNYDVEVYQKPLDS